MKTEKELLHLILDNKHLFIMGLCHCVYKLLEKDIIDDEEFYMLKAFIDDNRKTPILSISDWWYKRNDCYYWKKNKITPRINWIKYQIKRLNKLENENR